jgi:hypothetical protein
MFTHRQKVLEWQSTKSNDISKENFVFLCVPSTTVGTSLCGELLLLFIIIIIIFFWWIKGAEE